MTNDEKLEMFALFVIAAGVSTAVKEGKILSTPFIGLGFKEKLVKFLKGDKKAMNRVDADDAIKAAKVVCGVMGAICPLVEGM